jgi:hypothetical protein
MAWGFYIETVGPARAARSFNPSLWCSSFSSSFLAAGLWHNVGHSQLPLHAQSTL